MILPRGAELKQGNFPTPELEDTRHIRTANRFAPGMVQSFICEATVRFQTSSYSRSSSPDSPVRAGVRKLVAGRADRLVRLLALFTLLVVGTGDSGTYSSP